MTAADSDQRSASGREIDRLRARVAELEAAAAPGVDTGLRDALRDVLAHWPIGSGYYSTSVGTDEARDMADAILADPDVLALLPVGPEVRPDVHALRSAADNMPLSADGQSWQAAADWLRRRADEFAALPVGDAPTRPDVQPERLWSAPHGGHGVEAVRWPVYRAALADLAAAVEARENLVVRLVAEAYRKYPDAGAHWVNTNDLLAALARASAVPAEGDGETAEPGWYETHMPMLRDRTRPPGGGEDRDTLLLPNHGEPQVYEDTRSVAARLAAEPAPEDGA